MDPWDDLYIYLAFGLDFMVNVGKYTSPMDPMGLYWNCQWFLSARHFGRRDCNTRVFTTIRGPFHQRGDVLVVQTFFRCSEMLFGAFWVQLNIEIQETKYYWGRSSSLKGLWLKFIKKWAPTCCFVLSIFLSNFEAASTNFIGFFQWNGPSPIN